MDNRKLITPKRDETGKFSSDKPKHHNDATDDNGKKANTIAKETGVSQATVERSSNFSKGVDEIKKVNSELADKMVDLVPSIGGLIFRYNVNEYEEPCNISIEFANKFN